MPGALGQNAGEMTIVTAKQPSPRSFDNTVLTTFLATGCQGDASVQLSILNS